MLVKDFINFIYYNCNWHCDDILIINLNSKTSELYEISLSHNWIVECFGQYQVSKFEIDKNRNIIIMMIY